MKVILCLDDQKGMTFNKRRQSKDQKVREKIKEITGDRKLWMNAYSYKQFSEDPDISVDEDFLRKAEKEDFCFVENLPLSECQDRIETLYLFWWNRDYPSDQKLDLDLGLYEKEKEEDFEGKSHEKITLEVLRKC